jgi:hypothetical protein
MGRISLMIWAARREYMSPVANDKLYSAILNREWNLGQVNDAFKAPSFLLQQENAPFQTTWPSRIRVSA